MRGFSFLVYKEASPVFAGVNCMAVIRHADSSLETSILDQRQNAALWITHSREDLSLI
jgi:hypothetical protein